MATANAIRETILDLQERRDLIEQRRLLNAIALGEAVEQRRSAYLETDPTGNMGKMDTYLLTLRTNEELLSEEAAALDAQLKTLRSTIGNG